MTKMPISNSICIQSNVHEKVLVFELFTGTAQKEGLEEGFSPLLLRKNSLIDILKRFVDKI